MPYRYHQSEPCFDRYIAGQNAITRSLGRGNRTTGSLRFLASEYKNESSSKLHSPETLGHFTYSVCSFNLYLHRFLKFVILGFALLKHIQILFDLATHFHSTFKSAVLDLRTTPTKLTMLFCR